MTPTTQPDPTTTCRDALLELVGIGLTLARRVRDEAEHGDAPAAVAAFERVSRAVRRTVRMIRWLDEPVAVPAAAHRIAARQHVLRAVEDRIDAAAEDPAAATDLHGELLDRLDTPELDAELASRPVAEIVAEICRDLGISREPGDALRRSLADLAALRARAAAAPGTIHAVPAPPLALACGERAPPDGEPPLWSLPDAALDALARHRRPGAAHHPPGA